MTDKERIERLESIVKTLSIKIHDLCRIVNISSYDYELTDIEMELREVKEFQLEE